MMFCQKRRDKCLRHILYLRKGDQQEQWNRKMQIFLKNVKLKLGPEGDGRDNYSNLSSLGGDETLIETEPALVSVTATFPRAPTVQMGPMDNRKLRSYAF